MILLFLAFSLVSISCSRAHVIEGVVVPPADPPVDWHIHTRIHVDGREHLGFVRSDGSFEVVGVPSGSYIVEAIHPTLVFQSARVDINSRGKIRARRVNAPQPNAVKEVNYPLRLTCMGNAVYFKPREQLRTIDLLLNPSVLYVLVPFLLIMGLTKLVNTNDPELKKELQQVSRQQQLPDMSELLSTMFGGRKKPITHGKRRNAVEPGEDSRQGRLGDDESGIASGSHGSSVSRKEKKRKL